MVPFKGLKVLYHSPGHQKGAENGISMENRWPPAKCFGKAAVDAGNARGWIVIFVCHRPGSVPGSVPAPCVNTE